MRYLLLFLFISYPCFANAQIAKTNHLDPSVVTGHFFIKENTKGYEEQINVNYLLTPAPFSKVINMELGTANPRELSCKLVTAKGRTITDWQPTDISYVYHHQFDISSLNQGDYRLDVYSGKDNKVYSIPFTKN
ncbi:MAG TPA: hypothetical protein VN721_16530 [Flavipsychrobacter sp.]|nr:hypothetical protein [Flavipsychrobacter sp.]